MKSALRIIWLCAVMNDRGVGFRFSFDEKVFWKFENLGVWCGEGREGDEKLSDIEVESGECGASSVTQSVANSIEHLLKTDSRGNTEIGLNKVHSLEGVMLSETRQTDKDKYCVVLLICGMLKIQQTSE